MPDDITALTQERDHWKKQAEMWERRYECLLKDVEDELKKEDGRKFFGSLLLAGFAVIYKREKNGD